MHGYSAALQKIQHSSPFFYFFPGGQIRNTPDCPGHNRHNHLHFALSANFFSALAAARNFATLGMWFIRPQTVREQTVVIFVSCGPSRRGCGVLSSCNAFAFSGRNQAHNLTNMFHMSTMSFWLES